MLPPLRPYQAEIARAVLASALGGRGLTFTVEVARQGGKNEVSAQVEVVLLALHALRGGELVKAAPTLRPQGLISLRRLLHRLEDAGLGPMARRQGPAVALGRARALFLSAEPWANVVGTTASLLLEVDEAQDVDVDKYLKDLRPMGASANVTTVLYGTPWDARSLLEQVKQANLELERRDGVRRHFRYDWREVARHNPRYAAYVEAERRRLGQEHPLFRTQYLLEPLPGQGGLFSPATLAQLQGGHPPLAGPQPGQVYVAGVDMAGSVEEGAAGPGRDATVVTIGELDFSPSPDAAVPGMHEGMGDALPADRPFSPLWREPAVRVVRHYAWEGVAHHRLAPQLADLLGRVWRCRRVVVDATGVGAGVASLLRRALGRAVEPFVFTRASKSRLGFELLAAAQGGRLSVYADDGSPEAAEFWRQVRACRVHYGPSQAMEFGVAPSQGHDDYVMSLALLVEAARYLPRVAWGRR